MSRTCCSAPSAGDFGSRYTRLLLDDTGSDVKESYREYYSSEDSTASRRPTLTIVLGSGTAPPPPCGGSTLKVLQWNIAQGYGQDGQSNIDRIVNYIVQWRPDVVSFNEIMRYSSSSQPQMIADRLRSRTGQTWSYHWVQKSGASSGEGECVMTRLHIDGVDDHLLSYSRSIAMARVNVNGRNISVFSTHLDHTFERLPFDAGETARARGPSVSPSNESWPETSTGTRARPKSTRWVAHTTTAGQWREAVVMRTHTPTIQTATRETIASTMCSTRKTRRI